MATQVLCPKCTVCGNRAVLTVDTDAYERYVWDGSFVQDALDESEPMFA
jgi:DNA polymerase II large subunit